MKIIRNFLVFGFLMGFIGYFSSCHKEEDYNYFLIQTDSISIPETILASQPFEVEFFGYIGPNGCYRFSEFTREKHENVIQIEAWGRLSLKSTVCSDVMVFLNGEKLELLIEDAGSYKLSIKQPGGTFLERQVRVE